MTFCSVTPTELIQDVYQVQWIDTVLKYPTDEMLDFILNLYLI